MPPIDEVASQEGRSYSDIVGLRGFTGGERRFISNSFSDELLTKLRNPSLYTSIKMIDTHLSSVPESTRRKHAGEEALVLEIGGTNVYGAWVELAPEGLGIVAEQKGELSTRTFNSPDDFFSEVFRVFDGIARLRPIKNLGIIFSFPADIVETDVGVDVMSPQEQTKGFFFKDIDKASLGGQFIEYMRRTGKYETQELKNLVVLNDTPAALLSTPSKIGGIVGTGYNLAVMIKDKIYNIECGGASGVPQHQLALRVDELTKSVGKRDQLSEKQVSGMYLGMQLGIAIQEMNRLGLTKLADVNPLDVTSEPLSYILENDWEGVEKYLKGTFDDQTRDSLRDVARGLRYRSAELVAIQISTLVNTFPREFSGETITIPIEGSLFWKMPDYKKMVEIFLTAYTGKAFVFPFIEHAGAQGAAVAAIGLRG